MKEVKELATMKHLIHRICGDTIFRSYYVILQVLSTNIGTPLDTTLTGSHSEWVSFCHVVIRGDTKYRSRR